MPEPTPDDLPIDDHARVREQALANPEVREAYVKAQVKAAREHGSAEGRRQAAEGWDRDWAVQLEWVQGAEVRDFGRITTREEAEAHIAALSPNHRGIARLLSRPVGPWEPAEGGSDA